MSNMHHDVVIVYCDVFCQFFLINLSNLLKRKQTSPYYIFNISMLHIVTLCKRQRSLSTQKYMLIFYFFADRYERASVCNDNANKLDSLIFTRFINYIKKSVNWLYSQKCLKHAAKGNTKIACLRQVLA